MKWGLFIMVTVAVGHVYAVPGDRFLGGAYDGSSQARFLQYDRATSGNLVSDRFLGGTHDGYGAGRLTQFDRDAAPSWRSDRFRGGAHDGYAMAEERTYDKDSSPQWNSARFSGGARDGYAMVDRRVYDRASSPQWNSSRFAGGSRDGSDFAVVTGIPNPLSGDLDGDGLPDWWEALYYSSIFVTGAGDDTDYDGMTAWGEYVSGTVPTNGFSVFQCLEFSTPDFSNGWKIVRWSSEAGRTYSVIAITDILMNASYVLATNLPATPPDNTWTNLSDDQGFESYVIEVSW